MNLNFDNLLKKLNYFIKMYKFVILLLLNSLICKQIKLADNNKFCFDEITSLINEIKKFREEETNFFKLVFVVVNNTVLEIIEDECKDVSTNDMSEFL